MLSIQEKKPSPLLNLPTITDSELAELLSSRQKLLHPSSSPKSRLDLYSSYLNSLSQIKPRYPIALERSNLSSISFSWHDSFKPSQKYTHTAINSEKIVVLFNIAAVYSQMAVSENRETVEGVRKMCNEFQNTAGALSFLKETFRGGESIDVSTDCVNMLEILMLAQAQECFFHMAVMTGKSPAICSKVGKQAELYYREAHCQLNLTSLNQHIDKSWSQHAHLKSSQFNAETCYHYSLHLHEKDEIAEEIARLKIGMNQLENAKKVVKNIPSCFSDAFLVLGRNMSRNLEKAKKENDELYLMKVPDTSSLDDLPAVSLAKPTPLESFMVHK